MTRPLSAAERAEILDLLARFAWECDEGVPTAALELLAPGAVLRRIGRDGAQHQWRAPEGIEDFIAQRRRVPAEDRQTWTTDATVETGEGAVVVRSTSLHVATLSGGLSNVLLADDAVVTEVIGTDAGWRILSQTARAMGVPEQVPAAPEAVPGAGGESTDRIEIEALFADYAWAVDTADMEAVLTLFSEDAVMQDPYGRFEGLGPNGIRRFFEGLFARPEFAGRMHWVSQLVLTRIPEGYRADAYALVPASYASGAVNLHLVAFYRDVIVREAGAWKFRERLVGARWDRSDPPAGAEVTPG